MAIYAVLRALLLVLGGVAVLGFRFAKLLKSRRRKLLYFLLLLGAAGVAIQMVQGFVISYRWAQQHQHQQR